MMKFKVLVLKPLQFVSAFKENKNISGHKNPGELMRKTKPKRKEGIEETWV